MVRALDGVEMHVAILVKQNVATNVAKHKGFYHDVYAE
jgi:hypothetical protein